MTVLGERSETVGGPADFTLLGAKSQLGLFYHIRVLGTFSGDNLEEENNDAREEEDREGAEHEKKDSNGEDICNFFNPQAKSVLA